MVSDRQKSAAETEVTIEISIFYADETMCANWDAQLRAENPKEEWRSQPGWYWRCDELEESEGGPFASREECEVDARDAVQAAVAQGYLPLAATLRDLMIEGKLELPPPRGSKKWH
jgi:hypothetical protein